MGITRKPLRLVTYDLERKPVTAGYAMAGRYVALCDCGRAVIFRGQVGLIDCAQCGQVYYIEPVPAQ